MAVEDVAIGAAAGIFGAGVGAAISAWATLRSQKLSHRATLIQLRHDKLLTLIDKTVAISYFPSRYTYKSWTNESLAEFNAMVNGLENYMGVASFYHEVFRKLLEFRMIVRKAEERLTSAAKEKSKEKFEDADELWRKEVMAATFDLQQVVKSVLH